MTSSAQTVTIRILAEDAASMPVAQVREQFAALAATATATGAEVTAALSRADVALTGTAAKAATIGPAMSVSTITGATALDRLAAAATLAGVAAAESMTRYKAASAEAAAGIAGAAAAAQRFGAEATLAAGRAADSLAVYTKAAAASAAAVGESGAVAGAAFGSRLGAGALASAKAMLGPLVAMFAVFGAVSFFKDSVTAGGDELLSIRRVKQAFGDLSDEVLKFGDNANASFAMTSKAANSLTADLGTALSAFGISGQQRADMAVALAGRIADMAKFHGDADTSQAEAAVISGLKGRAQALVVYGVHITPVILQEKARTMGIYNGIGALNDQQKAEAMYQLILDKTAGQEGAVSKSASTLATQKKQLGNAVEELQAKIGMALIPVLATLAGIMKDTVLPVIAALAAPILLVLNLIGKLPGPIATLVVGFGLLRLAGSPLSFIFNTVAMNLKVLAFTMGEAGVVGAARSAVAGLGSFATVMAGPWGLAITAGIFALTSFFGSSNKAVIATGDFTQAINDQTGALAANAPAIIAKALADDGALARAKAAGISVTDFTSAVLGRADAMARVKSQLADDTIETLKNNSAHRDGGHGFNLYAKAAADAGMTLKDYTLQQLASADAGRAVFAAAGSYFGDINDPTDIQKDILAYQVLMAESGKVADTQATVKLAIEGAKASAAGLTMTADEAQASLTIAQAVKTSWNDLDATVQGVIDKLDNIAGRNSTAEGAQEALDKVATSFTSTFGIGTANQKHLDPSKILNPDGSINTTTTAGQDLRDSTVARQQALVKAAQAASDAVVQGGGTLEQGKAAAQKVTDEGYKKFIDQNTILLGSKTAAENLAKAYGLLPTQIVTLVVANTDTAEKNLKEVIRLQGIVEQGTTNPDGSTPGSPNPGTPPGGAPAAPTTPGSGGSAGGGSGPFGQGTAGTPGAGVGGYTFPNGGPGALPNAVGLHAGTKWSPSVERWRSVALKALSMVGDPASEVDEVLYRINLESGGEPNATNNWDSNAQKGTPSEGLVQVIQPTFDTFHMAGYANIWDPLSNILAGMKYSQHQYGSVLAGFDRPGWYDSGGWLKPGGVAVSGLAKPEAVLSPEQWRIAAAGMNTAGGSGRQVSIGPVTIQVSGEMTVAAQEQLRASLARILKEEAERAR